MFIHKYICLFIVFTKSLVNIYIAIKSKICSLPQNMNAHRLSCRTVLLRIQNVMNVQFPRGEIQSTKWCYSCLDSISLTTGQTNCVLYIYIVISVYLYCNRTRSLICVPHGRSLCTDWLVAADKIKEDYI